MKYSRLFLGLFCILLALWVIIGEQMSAASGDAVVNARVVTLRAPTAGDLSMTKRPLGAKLVKGEALASLRDPLVDAVRLNDLTMEAGFNTADIARLTAERDALTRQRDNFLARSEAFRQARIEELQTRLRFAEAQSAASGAGRQPEETALLRIALRAAEQGVFLGDGYNDAPNAEQRAAELDGQLAVLTATIAEAEARGTVLADRVAREKLRVNGAGGGEILAPANGLLWEILEADGVNVQRGDPILRMVDCGSVIVTLSVSERVYNSLHLGEAATFRLEGQSTVYRATISRLAGSGAATIYRNLAVAPSQRHLERYDVTLLVDDLPVTEDGCLIGQTGRVFFERRPLDWLRSMFS